MNELFFGSEQTVCFLKLVQLLPSSLLSFFNFPLITYSGLLLLLFFPLQFLQNHPPFFFLCCDFLQQSPLLSFVPLIFLLFSSLLLLLVLLNPPFNLDSILFFDFELFFSLHFVFLDLTFSVIEDLVEEVDAGLFFFLPFLLSLFLLLEPLSLNQPIKFFLVGSHILPFTSDPSQSTLSFFSFFLLHQLLVFCKLSLFLNNSFDHLAISFLFPPYLFFLLDLYGLIFLVYGPESFFLLFSCLSFLQLGQLRLLLPFFPQHLLLLKRNHLLLFLLPFLQLLLDSQNSIPLFYLFLLLLAFQPLLLFLL